MLQRHNTLFRNVLMAIDLVVVALAAIVTYFIRFTLLVDLIPPTGANWSYGTDAIPVVGALPMLFVAMVWAGLYRPRRDQAFYKEAASITKASVVGVALSIAFVSFFSKVLFSSIDPSRVQWLIFALVVWAFLLCWRYLFRISLRLLRRRGWNLRHVGIIGTGRLGQAVCHNLRQNTWTGLTPLFFVSHEEKNNRKRCMGLPVLGSISQLEEVLSDIEISGVLIAVPGQRGTDVPDLLSRLSRFPFDVRVVPDVNPKHMPLNMAVSDLDGMPILSVRESPLAGWGAITKRVIDLCGGVLALALFALPMLCIALCIRLSGGPVLFRQERMSMNGKRFNILKFRTMNETDSASQSKRDAGRGQLAWTRINDDRITSVGRLLRKTSLDELPQLFNVLRGHMSLVGPRPERPELILGFRDDWQGYMLRHHVKGGMTGWAQVNGLRGNSSLRKRLQYDLYYVANWTPLFDIRILWMTVFRGFFNSNAA